MKRKTQLVPSVAIEHFSREPDALNFRLHSLFGFRTVTGGTEYRSKFQLRIPEQVGLTNLQRT